MSTNQSEILGASYGTRFFYVSNTFISNARLKLAEIKQKLGNTLKLNLCYLKIIRSPHPRYHPKTIGDILKMYKKQVRLTIKMRLKLKNRSHRYDITKSRPRHGLNILYIQCVLV